MFHRTTSKTSLEKWTMKINEKTLCNGTLDLSNTKLNLENLIIIKQCITDHFSAVRKISFKNCGINDMGASIILELIKNVPAILHVNIQSNNDIKNQTIKDEIEAELTARQIAEAKRLIDIKNKRIAEAERLDASKKVDLEEDDNVVYFEKVKRKLSVPSLFSNNPDQNKQKKSSKKTDEAASSLAPSVIL